MIPYWVIFVLAVIGSVAVNSQQAASSATGRLELYSLLGLIVLMLAGFAGMRSPLSDADYNNYLSWFDSLLPLEHWTELLSKDPAFQLLGLGLRTHSGGLLVFMLIVAFMSLLIKLRILLSTEYRALLGFGLLFLVGRFFLLHEFTQVRAALGISLATLALVYLVEGRQLRSMVFFALGALVHLSTLALLPLALLFQPVRLQIKVLEVSLGAALLGLFAVQIVEEGGIVARVAPYLTGLYEVTESSLISVYFLVKTAVVGLLLVRWHELSRGMRLAATASAYGILLTVAFVKIDVLSLRLSELVAIFDCICMAYVFSRWSARQPLLANACAAALATVFYFSSLKIVNDYILIL